MAKTRDAKKPDGPTFLASLAPPPRKSLTVDSDGEAILTLVVPATEVMAVTAAVIALRDVVFRVRLEPEG